MSYDSFIQSHKYRPQIKTKILSESGQKDLIMIEGNSETLEFLSKLILELSKSSGCDNAFIAPDSAGSEYFYPYSEVGIYINKI